jgi:hypothetical protein
MVAGCGSSPDSEAKVRKDWRSAVVRFSKNDLSAD